MKNKTEQLREKMQAIPLNCGGRTYFLSTQEINQILQACNQWLEENRAEHQVIRRATRFDDEHFVYEPLRLEIDV